jgi:hypothetical protein
LALKNLSGSSNPSPSAFSPKNLRNFVCDKDALKLKIKQDGSDKGQHIVVPNGPLEFFISPYEAAGRFFKNKDFNYTVFGFDWRRSIAEAASYLEFFLKGIQARVKKLKGEDPLPIGENLD